MVYHVAIIGSGPAGLTAGIYTSRAKLDTIIIEGTQPGGQLMTTTNIENWPGHVTIPGPDLMINIRSQAEECGAVLVSESVVRVDFSVYPYKLFTDGGKVIEAKTVIIGTGASSKRLGCPGESEYWAKGVSTCATCDAPFFEDKEIVIVGGGNTAVTEGEHLTHFAKKITFVHLLSSLTANDPIKDKVLSHPDVDFIYNATITEIHGDGQKVTGVSIQNQLDKSVSYQATQGVFVAIGFNPNTALFKGVLAMDSYGYITLNNHTNTSKPGVFAAGDVADYRYRQAITSAGAGCMAALDAQAYLSKNGLM